MAVWPSLSVGHSATASPPRGIAAPDDRQSRPASPYQADPDRRRRAAQPRHGAAPEPRPVPDAGDPRPRGDRGRFHPGRRGAEHRLGDLAGAGWGARRPLRAARHDHGRRRGLCVRPRGLRDGGRRGHADPVGRADRRGIVVHRVVLGADRLRPRRLRGAPQHDARNCVRCRLARHADGAAGDADAAGEPRLADRRAVLRGACRGDAAGRLLGRRRRPHPAARRFPGHDARGRRAGGAPSPVSGDVGRLFRVRPQPRLPDDASADLSGDLRPEPDARRRGDRGDRRHELRRLIDRRLARRALPEAHPVGAALHPARVRVHGLFRGAADAGDDAALCRGDGDAVAQRRAAGQRPRRRNVRHPLHGDIARHFVRHAPSRVVAWRLGRRTHFHRDRVL